MEILKKLKELGAKFDDNPLDIKDTKFLLTRDAVYHEQYIYLLRYNTLPSTLSFKVKSSCIDDLILDLIKNEFVVSNIEMRCDRTNSEYIHFSKHSEKIYINFKLQGGDDFAPMTATASTVSEPAKTEYESIEISAYFDPTRNYSFLEEIKNKYLNAELTQTKGNILLFEKNEYNEMVLTPHKVRGFDLDINENYNDDFVNTHEKIEKWITDFSIRNNKLVLLHGDPGSGKTNYIKYLLNRDDGLKKIYIPPYFVQSMADPAFFPVIRREKNSLLIIEDAEKVLINREESSDNSVISILLNICDGIMADVLNFKIIATFNTDEDKIDPALKRRGRMFLKHNFGPLDEKKTQNLFKKLYGDNKPPKSKMTLAEIYNDENDFSPKPEKRKMGFVHD